MPFRLNPDLNIGTLQASFQNRGWVSVEGFLPEDQAEALREHLLVRTDWRLRLRDLDGRLFDLSPDERHQWGSDRTTAMRRLIEPRLAQEGFGYAHGRLR